MKQEEQTRRGKEKKKDRAGIEKKLPENKNELFQKSVVGRMSLVC